MILKAFAKDIVTNWSRYEWEVQGFGMLRTRLPDDTRFQIWDSELVYDPAPSLIHDHPWDFRSWIVAGEIMNTRYDCTELGAASEGAATHWMRTITPGPGTKVESTDTPVILRAHDRKVYGPGDSYSQKWNEIHRTSFGDGAVTVIQRVRANRPDLARVFYGFDEGEWRTAEPRPATLDEIANVVCRVRI